MEPATPQPTLRRGESDIPLAWTKRTEALLSRHGHDVASLLGLLRRPRTALYGLCLATYATIPPSRAPEAPEDLAEWFENDAAQVDAVGKILALIRHAYPLPAEKKSDSPS